MTGGSGLVNPLAGVADGTIVVVVGDVGTIAVVVVLGGGGASRLSEGSGGSSSSGSWDSVVSSVEG